MWGWLYLELVAIAVLATWVGVTPPEDRAEITQPLAAASASVVCALLAIASLNVEVTSGGTTLRFGSFYLMIVWGGFALLNVAGLVTGAFERTTDSSDGPLDAASPGRRTQ